MLLSPATWVIHLLTVSEWALAMGLVWRYGQVRGCPALQQFACAMIPHLLAGILLLLFHLSGDSQLMLLHGARLLTATGSVLLCAVTAALLFSVPWHRPLLALAALAALLLAYGIAPLAIANLSYGLFLLQLVLLYRRDPTLWAPLTIAGFWLLLVFVAATAVATRIVTVDYGLPSLTHHDVLHGASESLLTLSNLLIVLGLRQRLRALAPH